MQRSWTNTILRVSVVTKKRKGLTRYYHQDSKSRKNSAVTTGDKLRRNLEEGGRSALELNLEIRTSKRRNPMGKKLQ